MNRVENRDPKALRLWGEILKSRLETGEPYIMFDDNINNANPEAYKNNYANQKTRYSLGSNSNTKTS